ncbi:glycosyltransferase family 4 protein [Candidatus Saccharibacteria bacterium]|jgi:glycosyltransferase involved in cell wall biosynthesis|nr:glycosyltransferase family 4 protein [Candidatus Saccharibacteria bacterium]
MKSLSLLFVSHSHKLEGGAEFSLLATVIEAKKRGNKCLVILPKEGSFSKKLSEIDINHKVENYTWSAMSSYDSDAHLNLGISHFNADSIIKAYHTIQDFNPDIVIINTIMPPWYMYAAKSLDIPTIMMIRESFDERNSTRLLPTALEYLDNINHSASYILYNSTYTQNMYKDYISKPKYSVYYPVVNGINKSILDSAIDKVDSRVSIITPGSIVEHKNQLDLLKAIDILQRRGLKDISVTLMGHADAKGYIKTLQDFIKSNNLADNVKILDFSDNPFNEIIKNQIVVVPSKSEAFGRVTLEGQLAGRLVIGCDSGGTKELIAHRDTGLLYNPDKVEDLADSIEWAIRNPEKAIFIAKNGQINAKEKFLTEKAYDSFFSALQTTLKSRKKDNKRSPYFDPVYALIQRNLHVNSILEDYARSLEAASRQLLELTSKKPSKLTQFKAFVKKILKNKPGLS